MHEARKKRLFKRTGSALQRMRRAPLEKGNRLRAAKLLGISRTSLIDKIKKHGVVYREVSY